MNLIKYESKIIGFDILWITLLATGVFSLVIFSVPDHPAFLVPAFFEILMPVIGAVATGYLINIENDPVLENLLTSPKPFKKILLVRFSLVMAWLVTVSVVYIVILRMTYADFSMDTMVMALIVPLIFLSTFSLLVSVVFKNSSIGILFSGLLWAIQLIARSLRKYFWFEMIFLFDTFYNYGSSPFWTLNRIILITGSIILWGLILILIRNRERFLK